MATKTAPKKGAIIKKGANNKSTKGAVRQSRIIVQESTAPDEEELFKLVDGLPVNRLRSTPEEQEKVLKLLSSMKVNKQHFVVPVRLKSTVLRLVQNNYPEYVVRTSYNKDKGTVSVWRTK